MVAEDQFTKSALGVFVHFACIALLVWKLVNEKKTAF